MLQSLIIINHLITKHLFISVLIVSTIIDKLKKILCNYDIFIIYSHNLSNKQYCLKKLLFKMFYDYKNYKYYLTIKYYFTSNIKPLPVLEYYFNLFNYLNILYMFNMCCYKRVIFF